MTKAHQTQAIEKSLIDGMALDKKQIELLDVMKEEIRKRRWAVKKHQTLFRSAMIALRMNNMGQVKHLLEEAINIRNETK